MQSRTIPTAILLACASLTLLGFGCKPILDAQIAGQRKTAEDRPSEWVVTEPVIRHVLTTGEPGRLYLEMRTRAEAAVTVNLAGEGVVGTRLKTEIAGEDGMVYFNWTINRQDRYEYEGNVAFQNRIMESFDGVYDAY